MDAARKGQVMTKAIQAMVTVCVFLGMPALWAPAALANETRSIRACIEAVTIYSTLLLDEFDMEYEKRLMRYDLVKWPGGVCEIRQGEVYNLTINDQQYIHQGFAGMEAKVIFNAIEAETTSAIKLLESRIKLLEDRFGDARQNLTTPNPDLDLIAARIVDGIARATGQKVVIDVREEIQRHRSQSRRPSNPLATP